MVGAWRQANLLAKQTSRNTIRQKITSRTCVNLRQKSDYLYVKKLVKITLRQKAPVLTSKRYFTRDVLAATVIRRSQTAHCSHLRSRVSFGLESPNGNQHQRHGGERAEQPFGSNVPAKHISHMQVDYCSDECHGI